MKKTWILAISAAAVVIAGCNRELDVRNSTQEPTLAILRASIETSSRVSLSDAGVFSWQTGDAITVVTDAGNKIFTLTSGEGSSSADFSGDLTGVTSTTSAIFPATIAKNATTVTLPESYVWAEGQTNAAMYCADVDLSKSNSFRHLGGVIKITYTNIPASADALVLTASKKITGDFAITDGKIAAGNGESSVKINFTAGTNPAAFYFPVPTGEYIISVELQKSGVTIEGTRRVTPVAMAIERTTLLLMDAIEGPVELLTDIRTAEDFLAFVENAEAYEESDGVKLVADITLPATFVPETLYCPFDGGGHTITYTLNVSNTHDELTADPSLANVGLFRFADVEIKDLKTSGTIIFSPEANADDTYNIGGIVGKTGRSCVLENCENGISILGTTQVLHEMGGIAGYTAPGSIIRNCINRGDLEVVIDGDACASQLGGIIGHAEAPTSNAITSLDGCVNYGKVRYDGTGSPRIAGICAYINNLTNTTMTIKNCSNEGKVVANYQNNKSYSYFGGIVAYFGTQSEGASMIFEGCTHNGSVEVTGTTANTYYRVGGISAHAGKSSGTRNSLSYVFKDCVNNGSLEATCSALKMPLGGILGYGELTAKVNLQNCIMNGTIENSASVVGGLIGAYAGTESTITGCTITAAAVLNTSFSGTTGTWAGLLAGYNSNYTTALTGTIKGGTIIVNGERTTITSDNYMYIPEDKTYPIYLLGNKLGTGGSVDGVTFVTP